MSSDQPDPDPRDEGLPRDHAAQAEAGAAVGETADVGPVDWAPEAAQTGDGPAVAAEEAIPPPPPPFTAPEPPAAGQSAAFPPPPPGPQAGFPPPMVGPGPQPGVRYDVPQDQKNLAMISTLGMIVVGFISPLIVFVTTNGDPSKKFANDHAKEGLNFSIALLLASLVTVLLVFLIIGFLLIPLLAGWSLWVIIAGTIQASNGEAPNYPLVPTILK